VTFTFFFFVAYVFSNNDRQKSIKSLAYTVRSETNNYIYIKHKMLIKIWP